MAEGWLTVRQAGARVLSNPSTIRRWIRAGEVPAMRLRDDAGRIVLVLVPEDALLAAWRARLATGRTPKPARKHHH